MQKSTIIINFGNPRIGTPPIPGFGIGEKGRDTRIWDPRIAIPSYLCLILPILLSIFRKWRRFVFFCFYLCWSVCLSVCTLEWWKKLWSNEKFGSCAKYTVVSTEMSASALRSVLATPCKLQFSYKYISCIFMLCFFITLLAVANVAHVLVTYCIQTTG